MSTYLDLVRMHLKYTEKIPYAQATQDQIEQSLRFVNDAKRLLWNYSDWSFKTVINRAFVYTVVTNPATPGKGTPLPANFMGFHQTGKVYLANNTSRGKLTYRSYQWMIDKTEGVYSNVTGLPTDYSLGGPSDSSDASAVNQREILLWPTPNTPTITLKLVYQLVCPPDLEYDPLTPAAIDVEIPRIPATWHVPGILGIARRLAALDKGASDADIAGLVKTSIGQMQVQEPHGRERAGRAPINRAWMAR